MSAEMPIDGLAVAIVVLLGVLAVVIAVWTLSTGEPEASTNQLRTSYHPALDIPPMQEREAEEAIQALQRLFEEMSQ